VAYVINGQRTETVPYTFEGNIEPVYKEFKGWSEDITEVKSYDHLPKELKTYIEFVEKGNWRARKYCFGWA
jgi:adenylosuccinate synthase